MTKTIDIYGLGNALVDFLVEVNDALLAELKLTKGQFHLTEHSHSQSILNKIKYANVHIAAGGSVANATALAAMLGANTVFCGSIGNDEYGNLYEEETANSGTTSKLTKNNQLTGHAVVLITPDAERTFAVHPGASTDLQTNHINENDIKSSKIIHIDGYFIEDERTRPTALHAIKLAKQHQTKVSLDLSDPGVVQRNKELFIKTIKDYADIVFANEEEAKAITDKQSEEALNELASWCETAVVKLGKEGSLIKQNNQVTRIKAIQANAIDTTGAGDAYAAGLLYGITNNLTLEDAGNLASKLAAKVVEQVGARPRFEVMKSFSQS
jgi:sugar/nucleoside kinase (ribokinase family)